MAALISPVVDGRKTCSTCKKTQPISGFYKRRGGGYQASCRALGYARDSTETLRSAIAYLGGQ